MYSRSLYCTCFYGWFFARCTRFYQRTHRVRLKNSGTSDKKSSHKIKYKKIPRVHKNQKEDFPYGRYTGEKKSVPCCTKHTMRSEEERKKLINRLKRVEGQIRGIIGMLENDAYCNDILIQSAAVNAAVNAFNKELLASHIRNCVARDIRRARMRRSMNWWLLCRNWWSESCVQTVIASEYSRIKIWELQSNRAVDIR